MDAPVKVKVRIKSMDNLETDCLIHGLNDEELQHDQDIILVVIINKSIKKNTFFPERNKIESLINLRFLCFIGPIQ
jgi:hypothetical protein